MKSRKERTDVCICNKYLCIADSAQLCGITQRPVHMARPISTSKPGLSLGIVGPTCNLNASPERFVERARIAILQLPFKTNSSKFSCVNQISTSTRSQAHKSWSKFTRDWFDSKKDWWRPLWWKRVKGGGTERWRGKDKAVEANRQGGGG